MFPVAIGASELISKKPEPDSVFEALRQLKSSPDQALFVGDSDVDVMTARNAGVPFVGVTWGFRGEELLRSLGSDHIIHKPEQILELLN